MDIEFFLKNLANLVRPTNISFTDAEMTSIQGTEQVLNDLEINTSKLMKTVMHPCDHFLNSCYWLRDKVQCNKIFRAIKTTDGFCCAFNFGGLRKELDV